MRVTIVDKATGVPVNVIECEDGAELGKLAPEGCEAVKGEPLPGEVWDGGAFTPATPDRPDLAYLAQKAADELAAEQDAAQVDLLEKLDTNKATVEEMQTALAELLRFARQFRCWQATTDPLAVAARIKTLMEKL